jgi:tRNA nucleotidyltransferase (CCA-adding enzyme)
MTRDFTVNSIYYNYEKRKLVDPSNGIGDLENNTLKLINNRNPMLNNPFTIFRLIKMLVKYNMKIDENLNATIHDKNYTNISVKK